VDRRERQLTTRKDVNEDDDLGAAHPDTEAGRRLPVVPSTRRAGRGRLLFGALLAWIAVLTVVLAGSLSVGRSFLNDSAVKPLVEEEVVVELLDFAIEPEIINVRPLTDLSFVVVNVDDIQHDLTFAGSEGTGRLKEGEVAVLDVGLVESDFAIWCSIKGHREQGMEAVVRVVEPSPNRPDTGPPEPSESDGSESTDRDDDDAVSTDDDGDDSDHGESDDNPDEDEPHDDGSDRGESEDDE